MDSSPRSLTRRGFLKALGIGAAGLALDPEMLVWRPGAKTIFLPPKPSLLAPTGLLAGDLFTIEGVYAINPMTYAPVPRPAMFVVTADIRAGEPLERVMSPRIIADGMYQNVSAAPFKNAEVQPFMVGRVVGTSWERDLRIGPVGRA